MLTSENSHITTTNEFIKLVWKAYNAGLCRQVYGTLVISAGVAPSFAYRAPPATREQRPALSGPNTVGICDL